MIKRLSKCRRGEVVKESSKREPWKGRPHTPIKKDLKVRLRGVLGPYKLPQM